MNVDNFISMYNMNRKCGQPVTLKIFTLVVNSDILPSDGVSQVNPL